MRQGILYLDASAMVKLVVSERGSNELRAEVELWRELVSSIVSRVEVPRAVRRIVGAVTAPLAVLEAVMNSVAYIDLDAALTSRAARWEPPGLRSLDAIHMASAASLGDDLGAIATYDRRLADAAAQNGLVVVSPGGDFSS